MVRGVLPVLGCVVALAGCTPYPDAPVSTGGAVSINTNGDLATATSRARLACGEPRRTPGLLSVTGEGANQVATYRCL